MWGRPYAVFWKKLSEGLYPPLLESGPRVGLAEVGAGLIVVALTVLVVVRSLGRASLVPVGDPYLEESLHHHQ